MICFAPLKFLLVFLCMNVGLRGLLEVALPAPFLPQSASLRVRLRRYESRPPLLQVWMNISS